MKLSPRRRSRGAVSMMFCAVLAVLVLSTIVLLNSQTVLSLTMANRLELNEKAQLQLESVLATAKAKILADREFGKKRETVLIGVKDEGDPSYDGVWAEITFDPAAEFKSINNLGGQSQVFGADGVILDSGMIQLVAVSQFRNKRIVAYEMVTGPPLPFSLGSSGAVVAAGNSVIGGVESAGVLADGLDRAKELIEGGVVANGAPNSALPDGVQKTLTLRDQVEVVGIAQTTGSYETAPTVNLTRGEIKQATEQEDLPKIKYADYDPEAKGWEHVKHAEPVVTDGGPLYGIHKFSNPSGAVTFNANLELNGALVYVEGDVVLNKPLKGSGALVASGNVTILGGADIKADSLAAVVAGGNLTVTGSRGTQGEMVSKFTGLLYTDGNLSLTDTRTVGAAIAAGSGEVGSLMTIQDSDVIASPEGQKVEIVIQDFADFKGGGLAGADVSTAGADDMIIEPTAADLFVNGEFITNLEEIKKLMKVVHGGVIYDNPSQLPESVRQTYTDTFDGVAESVQQKAVKLQVQNGIKPIQIVKFDLNEFLNVSDRLRSSQTFYIEG